MEKLIEKEAVQTHREQFISQLFRQVESYSYSFLKYFYKSIQELGKTSDIDLIIDVRELESWKKIISASPILLHVNYRETSFATYSELYFQDGSYLEIDLIYKLKWKQYEFISITKILEQSVVNHEGIKTASYEHSYEYLILFFLLNQGRIPDKYREKFSLLNKIQQMEIKDYLLYFYDLPKIRGDFFQELPEYREVLLERILNYPVNKGFALLENSFQYFKDAFHYREPTLTFSGVDGAGKSTILAKISQLLTEKYRREVVILRHRPSILPILSAWKYGKEEAEKRTVQRLPRTGTNKSNISSLFRFLYYYLDYLFGQGIIFFKYNLRGKMVLYDRYYYDFIVDGKRSNIAISSKWVKVLFRFLMTPQINILLYADPDKILERKQELSHDDIMKLTNGYRNLFKKLKTENPKVQFIPILNEDMETTLQVIENTYVKEKTNQV